MQISNLMNQSAITAAASYAGANSTEASAETGTQDNSQGLDKVTLSSEGLRRSQESQTSSSTDSYAKVISDIKEKITAVKAEIAELKNSNQPEELKKQQIKAKQQELSVFQAELINAMTQQQSSMG